MTLHVDCPSDQPIIIMTRTFHAPRDIVWTTLTDPKHVTKWYGGHAFTNQVHAMDVRKGGRWRHTMGLPDGTQVDLDFVYLEVVKPERLVWVADRDKPIPSGMLRVENTVTLEDAGPNTRWKLVALFETMAERDLAIGRGFTRVITAGCEKLDDIARGLAGSNAPDATA